MAAPAVHCALNGTGSERPVPGARRHAGTAYGRVLVGSWAGPARALAHCGGGCGIELRLKDAACGFRHASSLELRPGVTLERGEGEIGQRHNYVHTGENNDADSTMEDVASGICGVRGIADLCDSPAGPRRTWPTPSWLTTRQWIDWVRVGEDFRARPRGGRVASR